MSIIFFRIAWMKHYKGVQRHDQPIGAGSYVKENNDGGEIFNFYHISGKYYGFVRIQNDRQLRIERLNPNNKKSDKIQDVTVVFFSKNPSTGGQYIVGWYKKATLWRETQYIPFKHEGKRRHYPWVQTEAKITNYYLIQEEDRTFNIPLDGPMVCPRV